MTLLPAPNPSRVTRALPQGRLIVYLNDTYYQLAQRHADVPRMTPRQTEVGVLDFQRKLAAVAWER